MKKKPLRIDFLTLFPKLLAEPLNESIIKIAQRKKAVELHVHNLRDWTRDRHKTCDDKPYGGGPGMVMLLDPIYRAILEIKKNARRRGAKVIYLSPQGKALNQAKAQKLTKASHLILLCGHYEGVDQRVIDHLVDEEISIGDFVTTGGELPALCLADAVIRLLPGVLGNAGSLDTESFNHQLLDFAHYTRPREYAGWKVPDVLLSGDHDAVSAWRLQSAKQMTAKKRPDMWKKAKTKIEKVSVENKLLKQMSGQS